MLFLKGDMSSIWKPSVTVAAIIERDQRFLLVEEQTAEGIKLNQPAGHLDPGESLIAAAARERHSKKPRMNLSPTRWWACTCHATNRVG
jgi:hypothetical protein